MVCSTCQSKLGKVITPDPWKSGARNTTESGERRVNENKALTGKKKRFAPYSLQLKCRICNAKIHQPGSYYCQGEYSSGLSTFPLTTSLHHRLRFQKGNLCHVWQETGSYRTVQAE